MSTDVVAAIIFYNNKILALQRAYSLDKEISLKFEFPGGLRRPRTPPITKVVDRVREGTLIGL